MVRGPSSLCTSLLAVLLVTVLLGPVLTPAAALPDQRDAGQPGDAAGTKAEARPLEAGRHEGMLVPIVDPVDWYRFESDGGDITVQRGMGTVAFRLHGPDGSVRNLPALDDRIDAAAAPAGTWHLEVWSGGRTYGPYALDLTLDLPATSAASAPVVVATFDTGTNPFHPCFRSDRVHPANDVSGYPAGSVPLDLTFEPTFAESIYENQHTIREIQPWTLYHIPGTNLSFIGGAQAHRELIDYYPHGSQASSMIACDEYGMGANAHLVIINHYYSAWTDFVPKLDWVSDQDWIDVVHLNIQDIPRPIGIAESNAIGRAIAAGKMVVIAAGNGIAGYLVNYPMELSSFNGPPGSLIVGASDQDGYTAFSNLNPHVVADGGATRAAAPYTYGSTTFSGTSSASPLVTGYVAWLLGTLRAEWGHVGPGLLNIPADAPRPSTGPLADGVLDAPELHELVRKSGDPTLAPSRYDGARDIMYVPQSPVPGTHYAKIGYGKVSEHTIGAAIAFATGSQPIPVRQEDLFYAQSERLRETYWG